MTTEEIEDQIAAELDDLITEAEFELGRDLTDDERQSIADEFLADLDEVEEAAFAYDPSQPRNDQGEWGSGGGGAPKKGASKAKVKQAHEDARAAHAKYREVRRAEYKQLSTKAKVHQGAAAEHIEAIQPLSDNIPTEDGTKAQDAYNALDEAQIALSESESYQERMENLTAVQGHAADLLASGDAEEDAKPLARQILDRVKAAQKELRAYANARREMRAIKTKTFAEWRHTFYDPNQSRDDQGQWGEGGFGGGKKGGKKAPTKKPKAPPKVKAAPKGYKVKVKAKPKAAPKAKAKAAPKKPSPKAAPKDRPKIERGEAAKATQGRLMSHAATAPAAHKKAYAEVLDKMPDGAVQRLGGGLQKVTFHKNTDDLSKEYGALTGKSDKVQGLYRFNEGHLMVDGKTESGDLLNKRGSSSYGTYSHEMGHAIDRGIGDEMLSDTPEWQEAWEEEIWNKKAKVPLSEYARSMPSEGFAETCRLLYGPDTTPKQLAVAEKNFPKTFAFFRKHGLWT